MQTPLIVSVPNDPVGSADRRPRRPAPVWVLLAGLLALCGMVVSALVASSIATGEQERARHAFEQDSTNVAAAVMLAIRHDEDLAVFAGEFFSESPQATQADFERWAANVGVLDRYPEIGGLGVIVLVTAQDLQQFAADAAAAGGEPFAVQPQGDRAFYCFQSLVIYRDQSLEVPAGTDVCALENSVRLIASRDSGAGSTTPYRLPDGRDLLGIQTPLYAAGKPPASVAERQAAFIGWVGTIVDPEVILQRAQLGYPRIAASMSFQLGSGDIAYATPTAGGRRMTMQFELGGGWAVQTSAPATDGGIQASTAALAWLLGGIVVSGLLAALLLLLGTSRERARRLVDQRTSQLRHQSLHDSLTGLPNRALVLDRLEQLLLRSRRQATSVAAMSLDLDDVKHITDTLGHVAGDELLVAVAARLVSTLRAADTIGRLGGNEFVVLIDGASLEAAPELVAERLLDVMRQPFDLPAARQPLTLEMSIGIAAGGRSPAADLLREADIALHQAKAEGKNRYALFDAAMESKISRRIDLQFDLRSALVDGQFSLVYQPIHDLRDLSILGVEALLRWNHPRIGDVSPAEFVPILEQSGAINEVGRWVLVEACRQMADWHSRGHRLDLAVNVSGRQLDDDGFLEDIRHALSVSGLSPRSLIIEITETALMQDADDAVARMRRIKELGLRISIDDFGTGYSSLAYLR